MFEPIGNTSVLPPAEWHPEPKFRGTFSILSSCLITMSLCIWTSLHLNLPEHKKEHLQKYRKVGWMVLGLVAPEMVVWNAWEQRKAAKNISRHMKNLGFMPEKASLWKQIHKTFEEAWRNIQIFFLFRAKDWPELADPVQDRQYGGRIHPWTDAHSWLVVMGGIACEDNSPEDQQFMPQGQKRMIINADAVIWMSTHRPYLIPDLSRENIEDKSKSDSLAKLLTCWQASYFCIQCVFRLSQRLSITLLELNVFAHAICALLLFLIWRNKPRDIQEPILLPGEDALDLCAYLCLSITVDGYIENIIYKNVDMSEPLDHCLEVSRPTWFTAYPSAEIEGFTDISDFYSRVLGLGPHRKPILKVQDTYWIIDKLADRARKGYTVRLDGRAIERLPRASRFYTRNQKTSTRCKSGMITRVSNWDLSFDEILKSLEKDRLRRLYNSHNGWLMAGVTFAGMCYGGIHLTVWWSQFPSDAETMLWRAASVTVLASGPFVAIIPVISAIYQWVCSWAPKGDAVLSWVLVLTAVLVPLWYTLCRTFLVVECLIMLAHIPETIFGRIEPIL